MKQEFESIILENDKGQRLRVYKVENCDEFCIGLENDESDHFLFNLDDVETIISAIKCVTNEHDKRN